jgi:hypothetical protein
MAHSVRTFSASLLMSLLLLGATASPSPAQLGVSAGLNFEQAGDIRDAAGDTDIALNTATGYHVGLSFEFGTDRFRLRPGIMFRNVGTYDLSSDADAQDATREFDVSVIEIPLDLRMKVLPIPYVNPYIMAGPMAALPRGQGDFSDATRDWSFSGNVGTGLSISISSVKIQPEVRYQFGVTDYISDSFEIGDETINPTDSPEFSAFSARLTFMF